MGQGVKRTQRDYSLTFKLALVEQIEKGELTYKQAQARYWLITSCRSANNIMPITIFLPAGTASFFYSA